MRLAANHFSTPYTRQYHIERLLVQQTVCLTNDVARIDFREQGEQIDRKVFTALFISHGRNENGQV